MKKLLLTASFILNCTISDGYTSLSKVKYEVDEDLTQEQLNRNYPELANTWMSKDHEELYESALQLKSINEDFVSQVRHSIKKLEPFENSTDITYTNPIFKDCSRTVSENIEYLSGKLTFSQSNTQPLIEYIIDKIENNYLLTELLEDLIFIRGKYLNKRRDIILSILKENPSIKLAPHEFFPLTSKMMKFRDIFEETNPVQSNDLFSILHIISHEIYGKLDKTQLTDKLRWYIKNLPVLGPYLEGNIATHPDPDPDRSLQDLTVSWDDYIKQIKIQNQVAYKDKKEILLKRRKKQQAEQFRIAQEQEQKKRQILEARRLKNINDNSNNSNVPVELNIATDEVYLLNNTGKGDKFKIEEPKQKVKTRGQAYNNLAEEKDKTEVVVEEKVSFEVRYLPSRLHKKFMKFWDSSAGTTYTNLKIWADALGVDFKEDTGSSHVHAYYTDEQGIKHHMVTTNHHSQDAYGKGTTHSMKKFFIECGLAPEYVFLSKEQSKN